MAAQESIMRLEALKRSLEAARAACDSVPGRYAVGMSDGLDIALNAVQLELNMLRAGEEARASVMNVN